MAQSRKSLYEFVRALNENPWRSICGVYLLYQQLGALNPKKLIIRADGGTDRAEERGRRQEEFPVMKKVYGHLEGGPYSDGPLFGLENAIPNKDEEVLTGSKASGYFDYLAALRGEKWVKMGLVTEKERVQIPYFKVVTPSLVPMVKADQGNEEFFLVGVTAKGQRKMIGGTFDPTVDSRVAECLAREAKEEADLELPANIKPFAKLALGMGVNYGFFYDTGMTKAEFETHFRKHLKKEQQRYKAELAEWKRYEQGEIAEKPQKPVPPELVGFDFVPASLKGIEEYEGKLKVDGVNLIPSIPKLLEHTCVKRAWETIKGQFSSKPNPRMINVADEVGGNRALGQFQGSLAKAKAAGVPLTSMIAEPKGKVFNRGRG